MIEFLLTSLACAFSLFLATLFLLKRLRDSKIETKDTKFTQPSITSVRTPSTLTNVSIYYATEAGSSREMAHLLAQMIQVPPNQVLNLCDVDVDLWLKQNSQSSFFIFVMPTYTDGAPPHASKFFMKMLEEARFDHRVEKDSLAWMKFAVFGVGDSSFSTEDFNRAAKTLNVHLSALGAKIVMPLMLGDCSGDILTELDVWGKGLSDFLSSGDSESFQGDVECVDATIRSFLIESSDLSINPAPVDPSVVDSSVVDSGSEEENEKDEMEVESKPLVDLEDLVAKNHFPTQRKKQRKTLTVKVSESFNEEEVEDGPASMITPLIRTTLTKQGYKLIGSHSGVKMCRWTKAMLRGRGGCYKHSFYGIASHQCMETTPSLACGNPLFSTLILTYS